MAVSVLVMTPVRSFGELIQQALQETGLYRVTLVQDHEQVLDQVRARHFPVAVLDFDLDPDPSELVTALNVDVPDLRVIAMKEASGTRPSGLAQLQVARLLDGSFYLPDLLDGLEEVTEDLADAANSPPDVEKTGAFQSTITEERTCNALEPAPEWLQNVELSAQYLTRLALESETEAILITRNLKLWAYTGHLPDRTAEELTQSVRQYWNNDGSSDFARFIRLDTTPREFMLYATGLGGDFVLVLVFDTELPFSKIRSQAKAIAKKLVSPPDERPSEAQTDENLVEAMTPEDILTPFPLDWRPDQGFEEGRLAFFEDLLSSVDIPSKDGQLTTPAGGEVAFGDENHTGATGGSEPADQPLPETPSGPPGSGYPDDLPGFLVDVSLLEENGKGVADSRHPESPSGPLPKGKKEDAPRESIAAQKSEEPSPKKDDTPSTRFPDHLKDTLPTRTQKPEDSYLAYQIPDYLQDTLPTNTRYAEMAALPEPVQDHLKDTLPTSTHQADFSNQIGQIETVGWDPDQLDQEPRTYACVLVPRSSQHHLVGKLATHLNQWVVEHCAAYGWRLSHLAIRPNYLHWVATVPLATAPGYVVRKTREHISQRIFSEYPTLTVENPSGDFWAPGYLIVNGRKLLDQRVIEDFISKARLQHHRLSLKPHYRHK